MAKQTKMKIRVGDIFSLTCESGETGFGQILAKLHQSYYVGVRALARRAWTEQDVAESFDAPWLTVVWTVDALFVRGDWVVVGHLPIDLAQVPMPEFVVTMNGQDYVTDFFGEPRRRASARESRKLRRMFDVAPIAIQRAFCRWAASDLSAPDDDLEYWRDAPRGAM